MNLDRIPAPVLDALESLESDPSEAARRFAGLTRWTRRKRSGRTVERIRAELDAAHREEVARALGMIAKAELRRDPRMKGLLHRHVRAGEELPATDLAVLRARAAHLEPSASKPSEERDALGAASRGSAQDRLALLRVARRLASPDWITMTAAIEYKLRGEFRLAGRLLDEVRARPASALVLSASHESLGSLAIWQGNPAVAASHFEMSFLCSPDRPAPVLSWFVCSSLAGDLQGIRRSSSIAEGCLSPSAPEVDSCILAFRTLMRRGMIPSASDSDLSTVGTVRGDTTKRLIDALL